MRVAGCGLLLVAACHRGDDVATFKVEPTNFVRRVTAEGNLKAKNATPLSAPQDAPGPLKIAWIADDGTLLKKSDVVVQFDPTEFETLLIGGKEDRTTADNHLSKTSIDAHTTRTNLQRDAHQADEELASASRYKFDDAEIFSRYQRIEADVDKTLASEKRDHANHVLGVRQSLSQADRDLIGIEARKADLRIRNAEQGLHSIELRAPYDGILVLQRDWRGDIPRVGATVWSGSVLGEIPDLREMKAEIFVLEADAAGLAIGQKAALTLESQPNVVYRGQVSQVDKLARPRIKGVPVQYFGVTLSLDRTDPKVMKPGARVRAVLEVENRANAFSIPRQALFEKEGKKIVYRRRRVIPSAARNPLRYATRFLPGFAARNETFDAVPVTVGTSSAGRVVVTSGVAKGDELALVIPNVAKEPGGRAAQ